MIISLQSRFLPRPAAVFAGEKVKLWIIFPGGGTAVGIMMPIYHLFIVKEVKMIKKQPLIHHRVRKINGSFAWISHGFLRQGFWGSLTHHELLLYLFLIMVGDRQGISYYGYDKICSLTAITTDEYVLARNGLIDKDLIAFDGRFFQVLSLPQRVPAPPLVTKRDKDPQGPVTVSRIIQKNLNRMRCKND